MSIAVKKHNDTIVKYDEDVVLWSKQQAHFLLHKDWKDLDLKHLVDEVLDVGKSERRELRSKMSELMLHLIKWTYQPGKRTTSWEISIKLQRIEIEEALEDTPSLKVDLRSSKWCQRVWNDALTKTNKETGISISKLPESPIWSLKQVLQKGWLPQDMTRESNG